MEEIRETAKGYYNNMTEEQKSKAKEMFLSMNLNGDGSVNVSEYVKVMEAKGFKSCSNETFFVELDKNGDGRLDFEEFMSLYYLYKNNRLVFCDGHGCRAFLKGIYFTCVDCFNNKSHTFNLSLLASTATTMIAKVKPSSYFRLERASRGFSYAPYYGSPKKSSSGSSENDQKITIEEAAEAFETAAEVGELVADCCECSIM